MACATCGTENDPTAKFCMGCGAPVEAASTSVAGATAPPDLPPAPAPPNPVDPVAPAPPPPPVAAPPPPMPEPPTSSVLPPIVPWTPEYAPPPPPGAVPAPPAPPAWAAPPAYAPPPPPAYPPPPPPAFAPPAPAPPPPPAFAPPPPPPQAYTPPPAAALPPAYAPPPPPPQAYPPVAYAPPVGAADLTDPNGLGLAAGGLSSGASKAARAALAVAGAALEAGERVELLVAGHLEGHDAVVALTDRGVLIVDDRQWRPVVERLPLQPPLEVLGWQDDHTARLTFVLGGNRLVVDQIVDRPLAVDMAQRMRQRIGS